MKIMEPANVRTAPAQAGVQQIRQVLPSASWQPSLPSLNVLSTGITCKLGVRAIGGSSGYSDWSDSVKHMSM